MIVPLELDRKQAVYIGYAGIDQAGRSIVTLVSICGTANDRGPSDLAPAQCPDGLKGIFAIKILRGEEYFVVIQNMPVHDAMPIDSAGLVQRIAFNRGRPGRSPHPGSRFILTRPVDRRSELE